MLRKFYSSRQPRRTATGARGMTVLHLFQVLYSVFTHFGIPAPLFLYLASTFVSEHPHVE